MNTNTKTIGTPFAIILTAILLVVSCVASLIAVSIFGNSSAKNTQDTLANAQNVLTEYNTSYSGMYFEFTNDIYLKADYIAKAYTDKSQLESMAKAFSLDSVKVTDSEGKIVAAYPDSDTGKNISDNKQTAEFKKVLKGISYKLMSTPQPVENSDEYTLLASMPRPDNAGIVIIGLTTDEYAKVTGSELAEECGDNIIVANKGNIVSSTVGNANASTLKDLGLNTDKLSGECQITIDGKKVNAYTVQAGNLTALCVEQQSSNTGEIIAIIVINLILIALGVILFMLGGKFSDFCAKFFDIKFWKFILVGIVNTVIGMGLQFVFFNLFRWSEWISSIVGYIIGSVVSYFLNKHFTFKNKEKGFKPILKFALNIAVCYGLAYGIAIPLIKWLCVANQITMFGMSINSFAGNASMLAGSVLFVAFNYIGQRFFAFKEKKSDN